jgi:two-component system, response regulator PdtaR
MLRVLIAEDEVLLAVTLRSQLQARGFEVVGVARNGQAALDLWRELRPDAILMDLRMPVMDGLEATRQIMAERPTCIVVLSALAERDAIAQAEEAGASAYLTKPANIEQVVEVLARALQECELGPSAPS